MKSKIGIIFTELFQVSLVTYLLLLLVENLFPGYVTDFFNLSILLAVVIVSGTIMVLPIAEKKWSDKRLMGQWLMVQAFQEWDRELAKKGKKRYEWLYVFIVSYGGGMLVYYKTSDLGNVSIILAALSGLIVWMLSYLILHENEK